MLLLQQLEMRKETVCTPKQNKLERERDVETPYLHSISDLDCRDVETPYLWIVPSKDINHLE